MGKAVDTSFKPSLKLYGRGLKNHGKALLTGGLVAGGGLLSQATDFAVPVWLWLAALVGAMLYAQFATFHDMRIERDLALATTQGGLSPEETTALSELIAQSGAMEESFRASVPLNTTVSKAEDDHHAWIEEMATELSRLNFDPLTIAEFKSSAPGSYWPVPRDLGPSGITILLANAMRDARFLAVEIIARRTAR